MWKNFPMLETILDLEPDLVDERVHGETPLEHAVFGAIEAGENSSQDGENSSEDGQYWRKVVDLLLKHGAQANVVIQCVPPG